MKNFSIQSIYNWYRNTLRHPKYRWWLILGSLAYLFSPLDISPDFIPFIGWIDDGVILTLLVSEVSQLLAQRLKSQNQEAASNDATAGEGATVNAEPIDVKAVSMN